jgi:hypothetical protein
MRALTGTVQTGAAETALKSIFASVRAEAASRGHVVGVRIQQDANGITYGVIVHPAEAALQDPNGRYVVFTAPAGREPIRFAQGVELAAGTMDVSTPAVGDVSLTANLKDNTTFTVLFSPTGQVVVKRVLVTQRDNTMDSVFYDVNDDLRDPVVPRLLRADSRLPAPWGQSEITQNSLWIYNQVTRRETGAQPWANYLRQQAANAFVRINPYTGQLQQ